MADKGFRPEEKGSGRDAEDGIGEWEDVTAIVQEAAENLRVGELVRTSSFAMSRAVNAVELFDARMDPCHPRCRLVGEEGVLAGGARFSRSWAVDVLRGFFRVFGGVVFDGNNPEDAFGMLREAQIASIRALCRATGFPMVRGVLVPNALPSAGQRARTYLRDRWSVMEEEEEGDLEGDVDEIFEGVSASSDRTPAQRTGAWLQLESMRAAFPPCVEPLLEWKGADTTCGDLTVEERRYCAAVLAGGCALHSLLLSWTGCIGAVDRFADPEASISRGGLAVPDLSEEAALALLWDVTALFSGEDGYLEGGSTDPKSKHEHLEGGSTDPKSTRVVSGGSTDPKSIHEFEWGAEMGLGRLGSDKVPLAKARHGSEVGAWSVGHCRVASVLEAPKRTWCEDGSPSAVETLVMKAGRASLFRWSGWDLSGISKSWNEEEEKEDGEGVERWVEFLRAAPREKDDEIRQLLDFFRLVLSTHAHLRDGPDASAMQRAGQHADALLGAVHALETHDASTSEQLELVSEWGVRDSQRPRRLATLSFEAVQRQWRLEAEALCRLAAFPTAAALLNPFRQTARPAETAAGATAEEASARLAPTSDYVSRPWQETKKRKSSKKRGADDEDEWGSVEPILRQAWGPVRADVARAPVGAEVFEVEHARNTDGVRRPDSEKDWRLHVGIWGLVPALRWVGKMVQGQEPSSWLHWRLAAVLRPPCSHGSLWLGRVSTLQLAEGARRDTGMPYHVLRLRWMRYASAVFAHVLPNALLSLAMPRSRRLQSLRTVVDDLSVASADAIFASRFLSDGTADTSPLPPVAADSLQNHGLWLGRAHEALSMPPDPSKQPPKPKSKSKKKKKKDTPPPKPKDIANPYYRASKRSTPPPPPDDLRIPSVAAAPLRLLLLYMRGGLAELWRQELPSPHEIVPLSFVAAEIERSLATCEADLASSAASVLLNTAPSFFVPNPPEHAQEWLHNPDGPLATAYLPSRASTRVATAAALFASRSRTVATQYRMTLSEDFAAEFGRDKPPADQDPPPRPPDATSVPSSRKYSTDDLTYRVRLNPFEGAADVVRLSNFPTLVRLLQRHLPGHALAPPPSKEVQSDSKNAAAAMTAAAESVRSLSPSPLLPARDLEFVAAAWTEQADQVLAVNAKSKATALAAIMAQAGRGENGARIALRLAQPVPLVDEDLAKGDLWKAAQNLRGTDSQHVTLHAHFQDDSPIPSLKLE